MIVYKDIEGYEGKYQVSNTGVVISLHYKKAKLLNPKPLIPKKNKFGYPYVILSKNNTAKTCVIHRLVAKAFIPNPQNKPQVNHKDGNKTNNNVDNLEWATNKENMQHSWNVLHRKPSGKPYVKVKILETGEVFETISDCARHINTNWRNVQATVNGKQRTTKGFHIVKV